MADQFPRETSVRSLPIRGEVPDELLTRVELADAMRISVRTVDAMRAEGMPCVTWGRRLIRFRLREATAWAEARDRKAA